MIQFKPEQNAREAKFIQRKRSNNKTNKRWTGEEIAIVMRWWPDVKKCVELTGRSEYGIKQKAQTLGVRNKHNAWSSADKIWLKHNWHTANRKRLCERLKRSYDNIAHKAKSMGLDVRGMPPPAVTGHPIVDGIRDKAFELGLTMKQLDKISRTKHFWQNYSHAELDKHTITEPLIKTVRALGGYFAVAFP